ncbi:Bug family tripartite tricarboxylate transporter substrate binding protein [Paralcaligenes ginsengisoli]
MKQTDFQRRQLLLGAAAVMTAPLLPGMAKAASDNFPDRPVKIIVPFSPGGPTDLMARTIGKPLSEDLKQAVIVYNKPGGGGAIALGEVRNAAADGYTLAFPSIQAVTNPALRSDFPFDMEHDFTGVTVVGYIAHILVVKADFPAKTLKEFVAMAKAKPEAYSYGSSGNGSSGNLAMEMFKDRAGITVTHVPYRGSGPAVQDMLAGQIQIMFLDTTTAIPLLQSKKLRALAIAPAKRVSVLPDVPTIAEQGYPGFDIHAWYGLLARAGTPQSIIQKIYRSTKKSLQDPNVVKTFHSLGIEPGGNTPAEFNQLIKEDLVAWKGIVKKLNLKIE